MAHHYYIVERRDNDPMFDYLEVVGSRTDWNFYLTDARVYARAKYGSDKVDSGKIVVLTKDKWRKLLDCSLIASRRGSMKPTDIGRYL